jgi:polysaccharide deacetylase 2 family uncharacterized protein YibQ
MAKKKKKTTTSAKHILTYIAWGLSLIALIMTTLLAGYYFGYEEATSDMKEQISIEKQKNSIVKEKTKVYKKTQSVNRRLKEVLKKDVKPAPPVKKKVLKKVVLPNISASHEYENAAIVEPPKREKRELKRVAARPKLAIIIDDVSTKSHIRAIKRVGLPLTMSFLPPSKARPNSAKLASKENFYMVHLPMEALRYRGEEPSTLRVNDSITTIKNRIDNIKKSFPRVRYINNHTGSGFTANERAMNRLITALNANKISFIDSRTTADTKAPKVMKNFGFKYMARDVFLDHHMEKSYVKKQIKEAIKIAKRHGTAIAIGHPHKNTLAALQESKHLFKDVDLVYINRLY